VKKHVLILGAGFGGLELATRLSETLRDAVRVTLLDRNDSFVFGYSKLELMLGRQSADDVRLHYREHRQGRRRVPPGDGDRHRSRARRVTTDAGSTTRTSSSWPMGADYDMDATPGLEAGGFEYYTVAGAERLRDALADFDGGRVLVSVLGQPFKCPPAPFEGAFLLHEYFTQRGIRDSVQMTSTFPMQRPVPVTGEVAQMFRDALAARDIEELPQHLVTSIDPATRRRSLRAADAALRPLRRHPDPPGARSARAAGLAVNGWVPVDQTNLRTQFPQVYALGDVCTGPRTVAKAGIFAESAALVVADDIAASIAGGESPAPYEGGASATPSSATGSSARSKSTSSAARRQQRSDTTRRASTPPREEGVRRHPGGRAWFGL
jgi:sulfide:quinone oxidoreductase